MDPGSDLSLKYGNEIIQPSVDLVSRITYVASACFQLFKVSYFCK